MTLTDEQLAEALQRRFRGVRAFQFFARKLGPEDSTYVSAMAWDADENVVEVRACADELGHALVQLFAGLDLAIAASIDDQDAPPRSMPSLPGARPSPQSTSPATFERTLNLARAAGGRLTISSVRTELGCSAAKARQIVELLIAAGKLERTPNGFELVEAAR